MQEAAQAGVPNWQKDLPRKTRRKEEIMRGAGESSAEPTPEEERESRERKKGRGWLKDGGPEKSSGFKAEEQVW